VGCERHAKRSRIDSAIAEVKRQAENVFVIVNAIETRRIKGVKKKWNRMGQLLLVA